MRLAQQKHQRTRLSDPLADAERNLAVQNRLMIRVAEELQLTGQFELPPEAGPVDADAHEDNS